MINPDIAPKHLFVSAYLTGPILVLSIYRPTQDFDLVFMQANEVGQEISLKLNVKNTKRRSREREST